VKNETIIKTDRASKESQVPSNEELNSKSVENQVPTTEILMNSKLTSLEKKFSKRGLTVDDKAKAMIHIIESDSCDSEGYFLLFYYF
jgi:hypothetical protein